MNAPSKAFDRPLRVGHFNIDDTVLDATKLAFERQLKDLSTEVQLQPMPAGMPDPKARYDLMIVGALHVPYEDFSRWLDRYQKGVAEQGGIWIPALILSDISSTFMLELLKKVVLTNWYFDIIAPDHIDSMPMRAANLLRIHDHLHELKRYDRELRELQAQFLDLERQLLSTNRQDET